MCQHAGALLVLRDAVPKKSFYRIEMNLDPMTSDSWTAVLNGETGKLKLSVEGLRTGDFYWFRVFILSTDGISGPSDPARQMASVILTSNDPNSE